jgi:hypothetical protein
MFEPANLKRWTMPSHYFGASWPNHYSARVGQSRDSDALERSNFACMLAALGAESDVVTVVRESHWAVGWVEWIAIEADGTPESDKALETADTIAGNLQDYPVIDESHWSELEQEDANETWANCYSPAERISYIRAHRTQFGFRDMADLLGCVRGLYFAGYASELLT